MAEADRNLPLAGDTPDIEQSLPGDTSDNDRAWLTLAEQSFRMSTDYMDANLRRQWERNVSNLMGEHPRGSKYHTEAYKNRSRLFRPKTRSAERSFEAALGVAFFSNQDVATVQPDDGSDEVAQASADINHYLLNYHLTKRMPWFKNVMGAGQDAWTYGIVWSEQGWDYKEIDGQVVLDQPFTRVRPVENMRIDPACDWVDPVGTSPYLIDIKPMYIIDVLDRMEEGAANPHTGEEPWKKLTAAQLQATRRIEHEEDSTRMVREGRERRDRMDNNHEVQAFDIVWIHRNIIRNRGVDYLFYTAGTEYMLSEPRPLLEMFPDGRPYVLGNVVLDTHRVHPSSVGRLTQDLQAQANSIVNQRTDNVELGMNTRFLVDRASGTDREGLRISRPGGTIYTSDIEGVRELKSSDVTRSAYEEQDRLNLDFDDVAGVFSQSSVTSNRRMNETVGGMNLAAEGSSVMTEYQIRVFTETWYEPVVRQILRLIQRYETDERRLAIAAKKAKLYQKFGIDKVTDTLMVQDVGTTLAVGFNATNPEKRIKHLMLAVNTIAPLLKPGELRVDELAKEVFGAAGYRDGTRFTNIPPPGEEPEPAPSPEQIKAQADMEMLQLKLQDNQADREGKLQLAQMEQELKALTVNSQLEVEMIKLATQEGMSVDKLSQQLNIERMRIQSKEREVAVNVALKQREPAYDPGQSLSQ